MGAVPSRLGHIADHSLSQVAGFLLWRWAGRSVTAGMSEPRSGLPLREANYGRAPWRGVGAVHPLCSSAG